MNAVVDFGELGLRDIQEIHTRATRRPCKSFRDVHRHREGRAAELLPQLEPLEGRKCFERKTMERQKEIVGALPGYERMMRE